LVSECKFKIYILLIGDGIGNGALEIGSIIAAKFNVGMMSSLVRAKSPTGGHSANWLPLFSFGPGSEIFDGVIDNTAISVLIKSLF